MARLWRFANLILLVLFPRSYFCHPLFLLLLLSDAAAAMFVCARHIIITLYYVEHIIDVDVRIKFFFLGENLEIQQISAQITNEKYFTFYHVNMEFILS